MKCFSLANFHIYFQNNYKETKIINFFKTKNLKNFVFECFSHHLSFFFKAPDLDLRKTFQIHYFVFTIYCYIIYGGLLVNEISHTEIHHKSGKKNLKIKK
jgi:hypothetical protein